MSTRLNKLLANRGIGARRKCDTIIAEGRVRVNGRTVSEPGTMVEEMRDRIEVDGRLLPKAQKLSYFVLNKPVGVITTMDDPQGRRTIAELLPRGQRLYPVGRLDADTSGLLLLTNDGELAHKLMHPRYGVEKFYRVRLDREPAARQLERMARGVEFEPGVVSAPARVRRIDPGFDAIMIEVAIHEGRFRQVRRMCEAVGLTVTGLHRVGYGPVRLGPLARGMWRELSEEEVERLRAVSARPLRRPAARGAAGPAGRPARPAKPPRPVPPAARRAGEADDDEVEDRWIPGGGFAPEPEAGEGGEWPARAGRARGDDAFRESGAGPGRSEGRMPWHAPEYRRGPAAAPRREERASRRDERPARAERRPPRRDERPARAEGRFARRDDRPARVAGRPPRRDERGPARESRGGPPAREGRGGPPRRGRSDEGRRGPTQPGRGRGPARDERRGPATGPREQRFGPARGGSPRAFSPRQGRDAGPARTGERRGRPGPPAAGRRARPQPGKGRPRNR